MPPEWDCLPRFVSKRLGLHLSSLSLCLRFGSLTQFPSTTDFCCSAIACQGGIAFHAAIFTPSVDVDYTAPKQDSRAAADNRSRGKSYSRTNGGERQQYRHAGILIPEVPRSFKPETANLSLSLGVPKGPFSFAKENGPFAPAARRRHIPPRRAWKVVHPFAARKKRAVLADSSFQIFVPYSVTKGSRAI